MKVKLLRRLRKDIRITDFKHGFYDYEMYHNFKWRRQGSFHFISDLFKEVHCIIRYRLKKYRKLRSFINYNGNNKVGLQQRKDKKYGYGVTWGDEP